MIKLPSPTPGNPDTRSPLRFLLWVARLQWTTLLGGVFFGVIWMVSQALMPPRSARRSSTARRQRQPGARRVVADPARARRDDGRAGVMRHRFAVSNWLQASFRMAQIVAHHAAAHRPCDQEGSLDGRGRRRPVSNDAMRAGRGVRHHRAAGRRDRLVHRRRDHPALVVGRARARRPARSAVLVLLMGFVIKPLQARQAVQREEVGS
jgi:hypothetical protein